MARMALRGAYLEAQTALGLGGLGAQRVLEGGTSKRLLGAQS